MRILAAFGGHDASATILNDGKIEYYFKEERYSRKKHSGGIQNIFELLVKENLIDQIDYATLIGQEPQEVTDERDSILRAYNPDIKYIPAKGQHHLFHASNSFYNSGFDKALVIVIDSAGGYIDNETFESESVYIAEYPCKFTPVLKQYWTCKRNSKKRTVKTTNTCTYICNDINNGEINIGNLYNSAALSIGQTINDCGKAMGLSSYGNPITWMNLDLENPKSQIKKYFQKYPDVLYAISDNDIERPIFLDITKDNYKFFADYCYVIQKHCQQKVIELVELHVQKTGIKKVCMSGGYAMNIITNYELINRFPEVEFYFEPVCDDSGLSTGFSMYVYRKLTQDCKIYPIESTFYHGLKHNVVDYTGSTASTSDIASILYQNKSVGVFYGHAEAGQRALGNRSILFNALNPNAKDIVNQIKRREWYRPFAAMVLEEDANEYFDGIVPNPFMTVSFPVKSDIIPGVTHVDGTCRVQTVSSGHMYELLKEFKKLTGHGILLNTSFNLAGQPLVETPEQAFDTLNNSSLDYLWFYETKQLFNSTF